MNVLLVAQVTTHSRAVQLAVSRLAVVLAALFWCVVATAATYTNASTTFNWINPATHTKVGYNTLPYKFNGGGSTGCGSTPPILDDTISDAIPIGFNFLYGATSYNSLKIQSNGRLQFGNNTCGYGTASVGPPQTYPYGYPDANMNNTMKAFGVDLDPTNLVDVSTYSTSCTSSATCYISYASLGTAPNRKFVVSWKSVPEWLSTNKASGSFDFQIILNEDGTFVYQYLNIVHGGTGSAQIGWQLSTTDYGVLTFGAAVEPPPNTAILFYVPSANPLAEYRFEEGAWSSGGTGQVADSTAGNVRPGTAIGSAQETSAGKVCRGASIPANTTAAIVDAIKTGVKFSDAGVNMTGQGTVMLWYKSNVAWSGAGAQAAQLIDATQTAGQWFSLTKTATGTLFFEVTDSTGAVWSVETAAQAFAAGTWVHIAMSWNFNALAAANSDHLQIFVNGAAPTTSSFSSSGNLSATLDYVYAGDNPSGLTGTKGSVNSANGTIDELRLYNFEMNQGQVLGASSATHACGTYAIDHLELQHATWAGVACSPGAMTVVACGNAACSTLYTSGLVATLSSSGAAVVWDSTAGGASIVIGAGQSSTTRNFHAAVGAATMDVTGTGVPVMEANAKKCIGNGVSCVWTSANDGLLLTVPNSGVIIGGQPTAVSVQAVQSSGPTPGAACVPVKNLSGSGLKVWSAPVTPVSFAATSTSASVTVGGTPQVANASAGTYVATPTSLPASDNVTGLTFDSTATTALWLKHMDTGQFNLNATLNTAASATAPALSLAGTTAVKAIPVGYGVAGAAVKATAATQTDCVSGPSTTCDTTAGSSVRVASAGDAFSSTVTAALWTMTGDMDLTDNPVAPSYAGSVALGPVLAAPSGGSVGALGTTSATLAAGTNTISTQSWTQSGAVRISATGTYLSQAVTGQSAVLGRFSPRSFKTVFLPPVCAAPTAFTYSGQPITTVTVTAMDGAATPAVTPNYAGAFARLVTLTDGSAPGAAGTFTANTITATSFAAGTATQAPVFTFTVPKTAPATLSLRAGDGEATSTVTDEAPALIRSGRLRLQNVFGSEMLPLQIPIESQYWQGTYFVRNTDDSCTTLSVPAATTLAGSATPNGVANLYFYPIAGKNQLGSADTAATLATPKLSSGLDQLVFSKPGPGHSGWLDIILAAPSYLLGDWGNCMGQSGIAGFWDDRPCARATFGIYRSPIIYRRENY